MSNGIFVPTVLSVNSVSGLESVLNNLNGRVYDVEQKK